MDNISQLKKRIDERDFKISVIGLGYVGLPLALAFSQEGFPVSGLDKDPRKVKALNEGKSYVDDIPSLQVEYSLKKGFLATTRETEALAGADAVFICVPTPLTKTKEPDLSYVVSAGKSISRFLKLGELVVLVSTTYPGTTEEVLQPLLEKGGRKAGSHFFLAFSPERVDPGNKKFNIRNTPKVVGGVTPACAELASFLLSTIVERIVPVSSPRVAEMTKLLENTYRVVNISLVNELAQLSRRMKVDIWEVIEAASTKPYGFTPFYPGPGMGGHCIPIDPFYLSWKARAFDFNLRFVELAGEINDSMPYFVVDLVAEALNHEGKPLKGSKVLILGASYKQDISDLRESPALKIIPLLEQREARVYYCDPLVPTLELGGGTMKSLSLSGKPWEEADCVLLLTAHKVFPYKEIASKSKLIVDTRNAFKGIEGNIWRL
ncbi:MAG: nucleotide sugar dehydrogenase [Caldiserica bacterium]|jgi:UDP-N-acetyl-D-glucosamine dehydrogenase|nr:nucleotide sugar dehydrogenase [Caldisericota bacterium]MDH7562163.1 nucleotide sugar dehydrogenase [Caldisericota bacterium]